MLTLEPKLGAFLLNTTQSGDLQEAFHKIFSEYLSLKLNALEKTIFELEKKYSADYERFLLFYKSNHDEITENDFYLWDETKSLLEHYKEILSRDGIYTH
jgi:hypothetical protein